ncbi:ATP-dependent DNA helicase RecG [Aureivirga sp. CE67]|uniref:ATP-dependent DNA helicase RecG n=1 Tax=Aureivirga sp. CE67 TaxID=1788983 RepID=UPI0018C906D2|nr:ATP-dependent DNA helicase RecG [Aureivirga sp. CE67]
MNTYSAKTSIGYLKGIGAAKAELLNSELRIFTFGDLLNFFPNRYIDRTKFFKVNELQPNTAEIQLVGKIIRVQEIKQKRGSRLVATFQDETGNLDLVWFRGAKWLKDSIKTNTPYVIFGRINFFKGTFSMPHPEMELLSEHKNKLGSAMQAIYPSTEKLSSRGISNKVISKWIHQLLSDIGNKIQESLPEEVIKNNNLLEKKQAYLNVHFPKNYDLLTRAQFRLKFEELFYIQMQLLLKKSTRKAKNKGYSFDNIGDNFLGFYNNNLPFELTGAQKRVLKEIRKDMSNPIQMNRLLQGDVGSGKTIVGLLTMLIALDNDFQASLIAPTEILATQHFQSIQDLLKETDIKVRLLTGSTKTKARRIIHEEIESGETHILIGTHAVLEDKVKFKNLGLAIIDEQHRFGVEQRSKMWMKNELPPHVLVMTATPIPRTLAMSVYGDLDVSVIDELPPGRKAIVTAHRYDNHRLSVFKFMREEIEKGRQVYVVYPLIEESENMTYKDLMDGYESIVREFPLPKYSVSIVHGKMKPQDKDYEMQQFSEGKTQIMVATTVIEVGVNVPNASVMVIESAERFGLSQLHQLRGRVGRGAEQSYCILMTGSKLSSDGKVRMETMVKTNDGFEIAEVDLKLRGPGDLMGKQQSGVLNLKIADIVKDNQILMLARQTAQEVLQDDYNLQKEKNRILVATLSEIMKKKTLWANIS